MRKLIKAGLISTAVLLLAINAWALPMAGDTVQMHENWGDHYGMKLTVGLDYGKTFNSFCVEKDETFSNYGIYTVQSVGDVAFKGGYSGTEDTNGNGIIDSLDGDPISAESIWLYAAYFSSGDILNGASALDVQNAIWYQEGEKDSAAGIYGSLIALRTGLNSNIVDNWNIKVVNLMQGSTYKQSQLVGEQLPVPEPATMLLFGIGLIGLAGVGRKQMA